MAGARKIMHFWRWCAAGLLFLCSLISIYLSVLQPENAGGRGGILVGGLLFFALGIALLRRKGS